MSRTPWLLVLVALLGCPEESVVPSGDDTRDYRITFVEADASERCAQSVKDEANNFNEFSQIYRVWFPSGLGTADFEVWWKLESESDGDLRFFSRGTMEGSLDQGVLDYAGGPYFEERSDGNVEFTIEGRATSRFSDELFGGREEYIIADSDSDDAPTGCVFTLGYTGRLVAEQDAAE